MPDHLRPAPGTGPDCGKQNHLRLIVLYDPDEAGTGGRDWCAFCGKLWPRRRKK